MDTLIVVAVLFFSIGYSALMVMFTIKKRHWAKELKLEQENSNKLWHQLDDAYAAKEELQKQLNHAQQAAAVAEAAWKNWESNYNQLLRKYSEALRRGDEYKASTQRRIVLLTKELKDTEFLTETYYKELQNAKELLKVVEWAAKTEVIAAKPRIIKAVPPTVQPQLATLLAAASISPELKRMLGL